MRKYKDSLIRLGFFGNYRFLGMGSIRLSVIVQGSVIFWDEGAVAVLPKVFNGKALSQSEHVFSRKEKFNTPT